MSETVHSHETIVHEKLVCRLTKLRVSTCEAVLWEGFDKLPVLAESGVGFLVADTSLWRLGGSAAVAYAEQAKNAWKIASRLELHELTVTTVEPRPFANLKAKAFVDVVKDLTSWLQNVDPIQADFVSTRRLSSSLALTGSLTGHISRASTVSYSISRIRYNLPCLPERSYAPRTKQDLVVKHMTCVEPLCRAPQRNRL